VKWQIVNANVLDWCREYDGPPFHAMLTDPPYELGFMGKSWDSQGIAFQSSTWAALAEHLLPGAWIMAFASSRGHHRLACALEDAGMILQPSIFVEGVGLVDCAGMLGWAQGQAFPKSTQIGTRLDALAGIEREVVGHRVCKSGGKTFHGQPYKLGETLPIKQPATPLAAAWEGHRYGGQVIKNCLSPIICAQKPWQGRRLDCIVETGAGAINVDAGRLGVEIRANAQKDTTAWHGNQWSANPQQNNGNVSIVSGRWPSSLTPSIAPWPTPAPASGTAGTNA